MQKSSVRLGIVPVIAACLMGSLFANRLPAQMVRLTAARGASLTISGSSNVHDWSCKTTTVDVAGSATANYATAAIADIASDMKAIAVKVPVRSIDCGKGAMNDNLYKALKATDHAVITYIAGSFTVATATAEGAATVAVPGTLSIAGVERAITLDVRVERIEGAAHVVGRVPLKMTDFGIDPPVALLHTLRVRNEIVVAFDLALQP